MENNQNTTAVAKQSKPVDMLKGVLNAPSIQEQFKNALGDHKDTFVASLIDLFTGDKSLQTCKPAALVTEALRAATLHLPLNKALGFAYIVVYNNKQKTVDENGREQWIKVPTPTFIPGYKGYIQLAMRTGQYKNINADVVYEGEFQQANKLTGAVDLNGKKKSDKVVGYFAYFELLNGFSKTLYMSVEDMASYAKRYSPSVPKTVAVDDLVAKATNGVVSNTVGWMGNFNDMAVKTTVRRLLSKYGYLSVEMQEAISKDFDDAPSSSRDEMISANANKTVINLDNSEYEEVDTETGEVINKQESAAPAAAVSDEPPY